MKRPRTPARILPSLVLIGALLLSACGPADDAGQYTILSANNPIAQLPEGLAVSVNPTTISQEFGVQLAATPVVTLANGQAREALAQAFAARPPHLTLISPLFEIATRGASPTQMFVTVSAPAGVDAAGLDVYGWDGRLWSFLPSQARGGQRIITLSQPPKAIGLFEAAAFAPTVYAAVQPGESVAAASLDGALLGGIFVQADGSLAGQLPNIPTGTVEARYPIISNDRDAARLQASLTDPATRANHIQTLVNLAVSGGFAGIVLDYNNIAEAHRSDFAALAGGLGAQLRAQNRALWIYVEIPAASGYDWRGLGAAADVLLVRLPPDPRALQDGSVDAALLWATSEVERSKLRLAESALPVSEGPNGLSRLASYSVEGWNSVQAPANPEAISASEAVSLSLFNPMHDQPESGLVEIVAPEGRLWLTTPYYLRQRFALAEKYRLNGVVAEDVFHVGVPADFLTALNDYKGGASPTDPASTIVWTVNQDGSAAAQATTSASESFTFTPAAPGDYTISAELQIGGVRLSLGSTQIQVIAQAQPQATPVPQTGANPGGGGSSGNPGGGGTPGGGFVPPPPVASGSFELGGQVPGFISHAGLMQQAGMKWVKYQVRGGGADLVAAGKASGFKVLLSVVGDHNRATDPAYWDEFAQYLAGLAAAGADAIEVWNEPNIAAEWPEGQISGATYTQLLAKAYAAIKAANPGTLVISAAPAPTGAEAAFPGKVMNDDNFLAQMAAAGAANYMDCVGIHFNSGTTSPNATSGALMSGYHYSFYFWPMVDLYYNAFGGSRQLCFTELGFLSPEGYGPLSPNFAWASSISVAQQSQWLAEAASLSGSSGKVRLLIIWNVDFTVYGADPQAGYAILRPDGGCPACSALDAVMP
jgi:hypothetical protein